MKGQIIAYSCEELDFIKEHSTLPRRESHQLFCNKFNRVDVNLSNFNALCRRKGWLTGRTGCFKKGNIPHPNAKPKGPNKTSFKKGSKPKNYRPVGSERISKDGYIEIKVAEGMCQWKLKHIVVWEEENGSLPKGHCLWFKDGNKKNISLDNLELVSRNENLQMNRLNYSGYDDSIKPSVMVLGKVIARYGEIFKRSNLIPYKKPTPIRKTSMTLEQK